MKMIDVKTHLMKYTSYQEGLQAAKQGLTMSHKYGDKRFSLYAAAWELGYKHGKGK
jgi:hypothetical protein